MLKVLGGQDSPHFTFDAVIDMGIQQEGVFAGWFMTLHQAHQLLLCLCLC